MTALTLSIAIFSIGLIFMVGVYWLALIEEKRERLKLNVELEQYLT